MPDTYQEASKDALELSSLTKFYGDLKAVDNLSLKINKGEIFAFLGPNGSGKTTTLKMILNFVYPDSGEIKIFGNNIGSNPELKEKISYAGEDYQLYSYLSSREILELAASFYSKSNLEWGIRFLKEEGLDLDKKLKFLSKGQKQLVQIVQALINEGDLIILDEPTGGLDVITKNRILNLIISFKEEGKTIIFSTHNLNEVEKIADRVGVIKKGELLTVENVDSLPEKEKIISFVPQKEIKEKELALPGVSGIERKGDKYLIYYNENEAGILTHLSQIPYFSLRLEEPDLEDIFLELVGDK